MKQRYFWALILGLALAMSAMAKDRPDKDDDHGHGNGKGNPHHAVEHYADNHHDQHVVVRRDQHAVVHHDQHNDRWESRSGWEYRSYERDQRPPGWSQGRKTGWANCNMPPGLAKKYGCNQYRYEGRDYYWYRDDVGRIIIRRPVISVHAGVNIGF